MKYTLNNVKNNPHNFFSFFIKYRFQFFLLLISLVIFATNYIPNTYLTGWDNLQTEFNPNLGVKRAFFGVWQEYQSFGLVSGLAHASDLIRSLFISFISLFLKQNIIRYIYHILMLLIGSLGMFTFLNYLKFNDKNVITFVASVFYMLNFGVIQLFYVPYEPFSTFFAILPWEIWIFVKLLDNKNRQNFLLFLLINALATPQAYIQTLFVVYILVLLCFVLGKALQ